MIDTDWLGVLAEKLVFINMTWYFILGALFAVGGLYGKAVYFVGAGILTIGIILMR